MSRDTKFVEDLQKQNKRLITKIAKFETWEPNQMFYSTYNCSNPPTAAELEIIFGTATTFVNKIGILDDSGGGVNVYLVFASGGTYFYLLFTAAV